MISIASASRSLASAFNRQSLQDYARGPLALVSSLVLLLVIRAYGESGQWGPVQVLALSLGMTGSMFLTAGFVTAISRRGSICLGFGDVIAARKFVAGLLAVSAGLVGVVAVAVMALAVGRGAVTDSERLTFVLALVGFSAIWLAAAGLSLLSASAWATLGLVTGFLVLVVVDFATRSWMTFHLELAAVFALGTAIGITLYGLYLGYGERMRTQTGRGLLPSIPYLVDEAAPYFAYGSLYMLLLVVAHGIGWVGRLAPGAEWLRSIISLEAGLTLSLVPVILAGGLNERALRLFWEQAKVTHQTTPATAPARFGAALISFQRRQLRAYLVTMVALSALTYLAFRWARDTGLLERTLSFGVDGTMELFFVGGLVLYCLLGWGQFNNSVCLSLNRPGVATRAAAYGMAAMLVTGLPVSLLIGFEYSLIGMLAGSAVFALVTHRASAETLQRADYHYIWLF